MSWKSKIKAKIKVLLGETSNIKTDTFLEKKWYGNQYGGFYVYPKNLDEKSIIYSFGVGEDVSFDEALIKEFNCSVFAFDPTPKSVSWVTNRVNLPGFHFSSIGISDESGYVDFLLPKNKDFVSGSIVNHKNVDDNDVIQVPVKCLEDIITDKGHSHIDVLKMDIEGLEYKVIDNLLGTSVEIKQILVEIHERFFTDGKYRTQDLLNKLRSRGYSLFAISDGMEELSFIKI